MRKTLSLILAIIMLSVCLCSCGEKVECDFCSAEYEKQKGHSGEALGEPYNMCPECYAELKELYE